MKCPDESHSAHSPALSLVLKDLIHTVSVEDGGRGDVGSFKGSE